MYDTITFLNCILFLLMSNWLISMNKNPWVTKNTCNQT